MCNLVLGGAVVSLLAMSFAGESFGQSPSPTPKALSLEQRVSESEKRIQAIESIPAVGLALKLRDGLAQSSAAADATPTPQTDAPLELVSWAYQFEAGQYEYLNRHLFSYTLHNRSDKLIKLIDGTLVFTDLLGEKLMAIKLDPDVRYPAAGPTSTSGAWKVNEFESSQARMETLSHDDIKATLIVRKVVFADNSIWSASTQGQQRPP